MLQNVIICLSCYFALGLLSATREQRDMKRPESIIDSFNFECLIGRANRGTLITPGRLQEFAVNKWLDPTSLRKPHESACPLKLLCQYKKILETVTTLTGRSQQNRDLGSLMWNYQLEVTSNLDQHETFSRELQSQKNQVLMSSWQCCSWCSITRIWECYSSSCNR